MVEQIPSVGRVVHYVLSAPEDGCKLGSHGEHRAAVIVRTWGGNTVQLQVFTDGYNDFDDGRNVHWVTSVRFADVDAERGTHDTRTWHWPEYVPGKQVGEAAVDGVVTKSE